MEIVYECKHTGRRAILIRNSAKEWAEAERELSEAGVPIALPHRAVWSAYLSQWETLFLLVREADGRACIGVAIEEVKTRALPGHVILRVSRFGGDLPADICAVAAAGITELAKRIPRVLRVQVNIFSRSGREAIGEILQGLGYREVQPPSAYQHTLSIDLRPSEDEVFASIGRSARKNVRDLMKMPLRVDVLTDDKYAGRLREMQQEALRRTGGHSSGENWPGVLKLSKDRPDLCCVFGIFEGEETAPEGMKAFGFVCNHGDNGEYRAAGSTRSAEAQIAYGYLPAWEMIRWAKRAGAEWFDFGGVTIPGGEQTALEGISGFKRRFTQETVEVGAEWVFEPSAMRAKIADVVSVGAQRIRGWKGN
jgi:hypothetical protein